LLLGDPSGELDRGDGFEDSVQRSAERAGLLPGDDRDRRRIPELRCGGTGLRRRGTTFLLRADDPGDRRRLPAMIRDSLDDVAPRLWPLRVAGIQ